MDILEEKGFLPAEFVEQETRWFYTQLGIDGELFPGIRESFRLLTAECRHVLQI